MTQEEPKNLLNEMRTLLSEIEWVEFKGAKNTFHFDEIGKYFSALSNKANLKGKDCGWLIFGIEHRSKKIVNTRFRINKAGLETLKEYRQALISNAVTGKVGCLFSLIIITGRENILKKKKLRFIIN